MRTRIKFTQLYIRSSLSWTQKVLGMCLLSWTACTFFFDSLPLFSGENSRNHLAVINFSSVAQSPPILCDPMDCSTPGFPGLHHLILCHPLLLLPSIFPSIRVFSNESVLRISHQLIAKIKENPQVSTKIRGKSIVLEYKNYAFLASFFAIWLENKIICFHFLIYKVTKKMIKFLSPRNQKTTELYLDILSHY